MPNTDKAMDVYLRLLAERATMALSHTQMADYLEELVEHTDPEMIRRLLIADAHRLSDQEAVPVQG